MRPLQLLVLFLLVVLPIASVLAYDAPSIEIATAPAEALPPPPAG